MRQLSYKNLTKIYNTINRIYSNNFKLKRFTCSQSMVFQLGIPRRSTISAIHKFRENILESSRNISESPPSFSWDILASATTVAYFTIAVNRRLTKRPFKTNGRLANRGLTALVN